MCCNQKAHLHWNEGWGELDTYGVGCVLWSWRSTHCWELTTFCMYTQLYMVLLVSDHLLLLKRQSWPTYIEDLGYCFIKQWIGQSANPTSKKSPSKHIYVTFGSARSWCRYSALFCPLFLTLISSGVCVFCYLFKSSMRHDPGYEYWLLGTVAATIILQY